MVSTNFADYDRWTMRLRFRTGQLLHFANDTPEFSVEEKRFELKSRMEAESIDSTYDFVILCREFVSEAEARIFGTKLKRALLLASFSAEVGIDLGKDHATSSLSSHMKNIYLEQLNTHMMDDVHGLMVYPASENHAILSMSATGAVKSDGRRLIDAICKNLNNETMITAGMQLAIELYCASCLERSPVGSFILAVCVFEALAREGGISRSEDEILLLNEAAEAVQNSSCAATQVDEERALQFNIAKRRILDYIGNGKSPSIGQATKELIAKYSPEHSAEYKEISEFRGRIAHPSSERSGVPSMALRAQQLAANLLVRLTTCRH